MRWSDSRSITRNWKLVQPLGGRALKRASKRRRWGHIANSVCVASFGLAALAAADAASAAPKQLYGKSVVVSWTESRSQRFVGEQAFRSVNVSLQRSIYVSTAGRVFDRTNATASGGGGGQRGGGSRSVTGSAESIGTAGTNFSGGARNVQFHGNSMTITSGFTASARRVAVSFDGGFQSCSAQVITAKQVGTGVASWRGVAGRRQLEVASVSTGPASCSIRSGNVFA